MQLANGRNRRTTTKGLDPHNPDLLRNSESVLFDFQDFVAMVITLRLTDVGPLVKLVQAKLTFKRSFTHEIHSTVLSSSTCDGVFNK
jgi:hypothetical protein